MFSVYKYFKYVKPQVTTVRVKRVYSSTVLAFYMEFCKVRGGIQKKISQYCIVDYQLYRDNSYVYSYSYSDHESFKPLREYNIVQDM